MIISLLGNVILRLAVLGIELLHVKSKAYVVIALTSESVGINLSIVKTAGSDI